MAKKPLSPSAFFIRYRTGTTSSEVPDFRHGAWLTDEETLDFVRAQAKTARFVTSVCTGSLVLGKAGLIRGKRAATHWNAMDLLERFEAIPVAERSFVTAT